MKHWSPYVIHVHCWWKGCYGLCRRELQAETWAVISLHPGLRCQQARCAPTWGRVAAVGLLRLGCYSLLVVRFQHTSSGACLSTLAPGSDGKVELWGASHCLLVNECCLAPLLCSQIEVSRGSQLCENCHLNDQEGWLPLGILHKGRSPLASPVSIQIQLTDLFTGIW